MAKLAVPRLAALHPDEPHSADEEIPPDQQTLFTVG
jgi:hypothetical protein